MALPSPYLLLLSQNRIAKLFLIVPFLLLVGAAFLTMSLWGGVVVMLGYFFVAYMLMWAMALDEHFRISTWIGNLLLIWVAVDILDFFMSFSPVLKLAIIPIAFTVFRAAVYPLAMRAKAKHSP